MADTTRVSLFGLTILPGSGSILPIAPKSRREFRTVQATQFALGSEPSAVPHTVFVEVNGVQFAVGTLQKDTCTQFQVDYMISEPLTFSHTGDTAVYLTGIENISFFPLPEDGAGPVITEVPSDDGMEEDESEEEDSEDEDDSDEEDAEDGPQIPVQLAKAVANGNLITDMLSDEEEDDEDFDGSEEDDDEEDDDEDEDDSDDEDEDMPILSAEEEEAVAVSLLERAVKLGVPSAIADLEEDDDEDEEDEDEDEDDDDEDDDDEEEEESDEDEEADAPPVLVVPAAKPGSKRPAAVAAAAAAAAPAAKKLKPAAATTGTTLQQAAKAAKAAPAASAGAETAKFIQDIKKLLESRGPIKMTIVGSTVRKPASVPKLKKFIESNSSVFKIGPDDVLSLV